MSSDSSLLVWILFYALPISLVVMVCYTLFRHLLVAGEKKREMLARKAINDGRVVNGRLVKTKVVRRGTKSRDPDDYELVTVGTYEYEYKGKTYRSKLEYETGRGAHPKEMELYYIKNQKKATSRGNIGLTELGTGKCFWIVFLFLIATWVIPHLGNM